MGHGAAGVPPTSRSPAPPSPTVYDTDSTGHKLRLLGLPDISESVMFKGGIPWCKPRPPATIKAFEARRWTNLPLDFKTQLHSQSFKVNLPVGVTSLKDPRQAHRLPAAASGYGRCRVSSDEGQGHQELSRRHTRCCLEMMEIKDGDPKPALWMSERSMKKGEHYIRIINLEDLFGYICVSVCMCGMSKRAAA
ncbi:uncharacterized protein LOC120818334 [Gasterosteus aculeatus]